MRTSAWVLAVVVGCASVVFPAAPALAHAALKSSDPAADSTVTTVLNRVTLTFNQPVKQQFTTVVITGADGVPHGDGAARSVDADVIQAVTPLPAGKVTVGWRTVSADGHAIQGSFAFTNAAPPPSPTAAPAVSAAPPAATSAPAAPVVAGPRSDGSSVDPGVWVAVAGALVVLVLAGGVLLWRRRAGRP